MRKSKINLVLFSLGALGYGLLEILWRGYTHWSMLTAGGLCFTFFGALSDKLKRQSLLIKAIIGSVFITTIELIFGVLFNIILKKNVWNYSKVPFNFLGQICAIYSFFWFILSFIFIPIACFTKNKLRKNCKLP